MPETAANPDLLRALGRLVRGLSALFWGLPATLVFCVHTARAEMLKSFGALPPLVCTGVLVYGLWQVGAFQKHERVWRNALDRARILSLINFGLSPFLFWWNRVPTSPFFSIMVVLISVCGLLFLGSLNLVLRRLGAMLPDEALRVETRQFTTLNFNLLCALPALGLIWFAFSRWPALVSNLPFLKPPLDSGSLWLLLPLVPFVLLPLAMTMALLWKTKEVILDNVFCAKPPMA